MMLSEVVGQEVKVRIELKQGNLVYQKTLPAETLVYAEGRYSLAQSHLEIPEDKVKGINIEKGHMVLAMEGVH